MKKILSLQKLSTDSQSGGGNSNASLLLCFGYSVLSVIQC